MSQSESQYEDFRLHKDALINSMLPNVELSVKLIEKEQEKISNRLELLRKGLRSAGVRISMSYGGYVH